MSGLFIPVVFFPRFTGLIGPSEFFSVPMPCSLFAGLKVVVWHGNVLGTLPTVTVKMQESNEGESYFDCPSSPLVISNTLGEYPLSTTITRAWFRLGVSLTGVNAATSVWAQGFFEKRER